jgi:hypothetical protein
VPVEASASDAGTDSNVGCSPGSIDAGALDGGACNALSLIGPAFTSQNVNGSAPSTPSGGVIEDGTYVEQSETWYGSGCAFPIETGKAVWAICGGTIQTASQFTSGDSGTFTTAETGTLSTSGTTVQLQFDCPSPSSPIPEGYDASGGVLRTYKQVGPCTRVDVFQKQ